MLNDTRRASALFFFAGKEGEGMAKVGTARGGARVGTGRRPKELADKIALGKPAEVIFLPEPPEMEFKRGSKDGNLLSGLTEAMIEYFS